jgi:hypothetical protein
MSMCLYLARGREDVLRKFADDPETLVDLPRGGKATIFDRLNLSTEDKLAHIETLLERQPHLRGMVEQVMGMVGAARANPLATAGATPGGGSSGGLGGGSFGGGFAGSTAPRGAAAPARPPVLDLHKSWHMFHFVFTGRAQGGEPPGSLLMEGGEEVGEDMGYGPPRLIGIADTAALAGFVGALSVDEIKGRLDGTRMAALQIYPGFDAVDAVEEYGDDVEHYFPALRDYLAAAAAAREATLVWLS